MEAAVGCAGALSVLYIILGIALLIAPLMIWSKVSAILKNIEMTNIYLKHIAASTEGALKYAALRDDAERQSMAGAKASSRS